MICGHRKVATFSKQQEMFPAEKAGQSEIMLDKENIPVHVAVIMDGNGRWAKKRFLPAFAGHNAGMKAMIEIVRHADHLGIGYLTVYAFSTENWKRSEE